MSRPTRVDVDGAGMARLLDLVADLGGVDAVIAAVERGSASAPTRARATVPFRHAGDVLEAFDRKLVTAEVARRLLGRPARKPARTRPRVLPRAGVDSP